MHGDEGEEEQEGDDLQRLEQDHREGVELVVADVNSKTIHSGYPLCGMRPAGSDRPRSSGAPIIAVAQPAATTSRHFPRKSACPKGPAGGAGSEPAAGDNSVIRGFIPGSLWDRRPPFVAVMWSTHEWPINRAVRLGSNAPR